MPWVVAMTRPNCEGVAALNLERQGFACYVPRFLLTRHGKKSQRRPLFPRYVFVWIGDFWYAITGTYGVSRLLMGDSGGPAILPEGVIDELKGRENRRGLISLTPKPKFLPGEACKASSGPLSGHVLIYEGMRAHERVSVLVSLLGRQVRAEVLEASLVAA